MNSSRANSATMAMTAMTALTRVLVLVVLASLASSISAAQAEATRSPQTRLTLARAMAMAEAHYPQIRAALEQQSAARGKIAVARTAYLPRADLLWQTNRATANNIYGLLRASEEKHGKTSRKLYMATPAGRRALRVAKKRVKELFGELFESK